jgi:hypothetical protein
MVYGEAQCSSSAAVHLYAEMYPQTRHLNSWTFISLDKCLREADCWCPNMANSKCWLTTKSQVYQCWRTYSACCWTVHSCWLAYHHCNVSHSMAWEVLNKQLLYQYHIQLIQALQPMDPQQWTAFILTACLGSGTIQQEVYNSKEVQTKSCEIPNAWKKVQMWAKHTNWQKEIYTTAKLSASNDMVCKKKYIYIYTSCFKKSFTTSKGYIDLFRGHTQRIYIYI